MRVGYARVSTTEQDIESQIARLADCDPVFAEKQSGAKRGRVELERCLEYVRQGDTLVVVRLDRLARSMGHLLDISRLLERKGVELVVLDQPIDTRTAAGKLFFHMIAAFAEFELDVRRDAQAAGMAHARARGTHMGRSPFLTTPQMEQLAQLYREGATQKELALRFHISPRSVRRYLVYTRQIAQA